MSDSVYFGDIMRTLHEIRDELKSMNKKLDKLNQTEKNQNVLTNSSQILDWFYKNLDLVNNGKILQIKKIANEIGCDIKDIINEINNGITLTYDRRCQHVVFCENEFCSLDTEETVRVCLSKYLKNNEFVIIGDLGKELPFQKPTLIKKAVRMCGNDKKTIENELKPYLKSNGIDLLAYSQSKLIVIELKGVTKAKSDFKDTIMQIIDRFWKFKDILSDEEFKRVSFACGVPNFLPSISREHYQEERKRLYNMKNENKPEEFLWFAAATNTIKQKGLEKLKPFVYDKPNIVDLLNTGKFQFYFVESDKNITKL